MSITWNPLKMTHKQFKKANSLILSVLATTLFLMLLLLAVGCVSEKEVIYKRIYFADTNGVTTIYYPQSMEKDLITPHDADRWRHIVSKVAPDDGAAKEMKKPTPLGQFQQIPTWEEYKEQKQQQLADEYHTQHPECSYSYQK